MRKKKQEKFITLLLYLLLPGALLWYFLFYRLEIWRPSGLVARQISTLKQVIKPYPRLSWLSTKDRFIVDAQGRQMILRGVNLASIHWGVDAWNPKAVAYAAKNWQVKVIRTRIYQDDWQKDRTKFFDDLEWQILDPARAHGVYVILSPFIGQDNRCLPDEQTIAMWQELAGRYKDDPTVLYDVLPEPRDVTKLALVEGYRKIIEAMRAVHPRSLIFVTGLGWGREINSYLEAPLAYPNVVYRSNPYNQAGEFEGLFGRIAQVYPVFLGEFGAEGYPVMSRADVQALLVYADQLELGWTAWNFFSQGCPCLLADYKKFMPSAYGQIVLQYLQQNPRKNFNDLLWTDSEGESGGAGVIYQDGLQHGFVNQSDKVTIELLDEGMIKDGRRSLKVDYQPEGALFLHTFDVVNTESFTFLELALNWAENQNFPLALFLKDIEDRDLLRVSLNRYFTTTIGDWQVYRIPLSSLAAENLFVSGLVIQEAGGAERKALYFTDINFK